MHIMNKYGKKIYQMNKSRIINNQKRFLSHNKPDITIFNANTVIRDDEFSFLIIKSTSCHVESEDFFKVHAFKS